MSVHDFLSKIRISGSSPPQATKRASQFQRPFLRRGAHLNVTSTPLQSEYKKDTAYCVACLEFIMSRIHEVFCSWLDVHKSLHLLPEDERATWIDFILEGEVPATVGKNLLVCAITTLRLTVSPTSVSTRKD